MVQVSLGDLLTTTDPSFLGVNIDAASLYEKTRLDFKDKNLNKIAAVLSKASPAPLVLRVGGSTADDLSFHENSNLTVHMPLQYWDEMMEFVNVNGLALAFDINAMSMRYVDNGKSLWNESEAKFLLDHMKDAKQSLHAFQLGNEPGHWQTRHEGSPTPRTMVQTFKIERLLRDYFSEDTRPRIQGPDVCFGSGTDESPCASADYFEAASGIEWHHPGCDCA